MQDYLKSQIEGKIGYLILDREEKRNALNPDLVKALSSKLTEWNDMDEIRVIIIKANGPVFSAGADLEYLQQLQTNSFDENLEDSKLLKDLFQLIHNSPKIVIAQIQGHAIAGGCGLASICDYSFAVPEARFGYTEVKIGFVPALVMVYLIRKIGESSARSLMLSGDLIDAAKAESIGLIDGVVTAGELEEHVNSFAEKLASQTSPASIKRTKNMISAVQNMSLEEALEYAAIQNAEARATDDCKKGIASFLNKDKLTW